jgi:predicted RNA-binding protein Jag
MEEASTISKAIESAWNRAGQPQEFSIKILEHPKTSFFGLKTSKSAKIAFFFNELTVKAKEQPHQRQTRPIAPRNPQQAKTSEYGEPRGQQQRKPYQQRGDRPEARTNGTDSRPQPHHRADQPRPQGPRTDRPEHKQYSQQRPERQDHFTKSEKQADPRHSQPNRAPHESTQHDEAPKNISREPARHERQESSFARSTEERSENEARRFERPQAPRYQQDENRDIWTPEMVEAAHDWVKETLVMMGKPNTTVSHHISHNYLKLTLDTPVADDARQEEIQLKSWGSLAMEAVREKTQKPLRSLRIILEGRR